MFDLKIIMLPKIKNVLQFKGTYKYKTITIRNNSAGKYREPHNYYNTKQNKFINIGISQSSDV